MARTEHTSQALTVHGQAPQRRLHGWQRVVRSILSRPLAIVGAAFLMIGLIVMIAAPVLAPHDPVYQTRSERLLPPLSQGPDTGTFYLFGTDSLGRDVLSRVIHGARVSLLIGILSVGISAPLGVTLGLLSGYFHRIVDDIIMRIADVQLAFPFILLAMAVVAVLSPSARNIILVLGISGWVLYARIVRSLVLSISNQEYVHAARAIGCGHSRILFRHILPNVLSSVIVIATFALAFMILLESGLSFLGLGVQPPNPTWGGMLADSRNYIAIAWWISVFPGLAIMFTVMSVNFVGDWLRDLLDPRAQL